jgi:hypothetical protein
MPKRHHSLKQAAIEAEAPLHYILAPVFIQGTFHHKPEPERLLLRHFYSSRGIKIGPELMNLYFISTMILI